jgi:adenine-specific DNA-methyltransferase
MSGMKMSHADRKPPKIKEYITLSNLSEKARINPVFEQCGWFEAFDRYDSFLIRNDSHDPENWTRTSLRNAAISAGVDVSDESEYNKFCIGNADSIYQRAKNDSLHDLPRDGKFRAVVTATGMNKIALDGKEVLFASNYLKEIEGEKVPAKIKGDIWDDIGINNSHNEGGVSFENGKKPVKLFERLVHMLTPKDATIIDIFAGSGTIAHAVMNLNNAANKRKFVLIEMGEYFDSVLKKRIINASYSSDWQAGKPIRSGKSSSILVKYIRLESYEDTLNNLVFDDNPVRRNAIESNPLLKEDYMLRYLLDVETRGSQSLLNIDAFADPTAYSLVVKKPGSDEQVTRNTDLIETFNYLLGLRLEHMAAPQTFTASFIRKPDPELPGDQHTKLVVDGKIQQATDGKWWFRKLEGWVPADLMSPNNGKKEKVLIVWRKLTGNLEEDNLMLDEWFRKYRISSRESKEFDVIYVNGSNNLPNLKKDEERWKVRLIEESFHKLMWAMEGKA